MSVIHNFGTIGTTKPRVKVVEVSARRWFQKSYGNTYHKVKVYVNDELIGTSPITYGYGEQYLETAKKILIDKGYFPRALKNAGSLYTFLKNRKIKFIYNVTDVKREKDLKNF